MPRKNFDLFLKESEFRFNIKDKSKDEKFEIIKSVFKEIYDNNKFKFD